MIGIVTTRWQRWVAFVGQQETGEALALFRIVSGVALLVAVGAPALVGLTEAFWVDIEYGGMRKLQSSWLVDLLGGNTPQTAWTLVVGCIGASLCLILGVSGRIAALVGGQCLIALSHANTHARSSYDGLLINSLWLLVLADSTAGGPDA